jgi:hypothetical protein
MDARCGAFCETQWGLIKPSQQKEQAQRASNRVTHPQPIRPKDVEMQLMTVSLSLSVYFPLFTCIPLFLSVQSDSIEILSLSLSGSRFLLRLVRMDPNTPYHKNVPIKTISYYKMHVRHFHLLGKRYYSGACSSMNLLTSVS